MHSKIYQKTIIKWIGSLAVFISTVVAAISLSLYNWYAVDNVKLYSEMTVGMLQNTSRSIEILDRSIINAGFLQVHDHELTSMMTNTGIDYNLYYPVQEKLIRFIFTNPLVSSIYLVNPRANLIIGSPSLGLVQADAYSRFIHPLIADRKEQAIIRIDTYQPRIEGLSAADEPTISYVFYQTRQNAEDDSFLIVNVKQSDMAGALIDINPMKDTDILALDSRGTVVYSRDPAQLYRDYGADANFRTHVIDSTATSGFFMWEVHGTASLVTFTASEDLGYKFISLTPYEIVRQAAMELKARTIALSIAILLIGFAAAVLLARYFHFPLRRLIHKYSNKPGSDEPAVRYKNEFEMLDGLLEAHHSKADSLDQFVNQHLPIIKQDFLTNMLEGRIPLDNELTKERLSEIGANFAGDTYQVVLLKPGRSERKQGNEPRDDSLLRRTLCDLADALMKPVCGCETVWNMNGAYLVMLLNYDAGSDAIREQIRGSFLTLQHEARLLHDTALTVVCGPACDSHPHHSYQQAVELLRYTVKYGEGVLIDEPTVKQDIAGYDLFPEQEERQLMKSLRSLSVEDSRAGIEALVKTLYGYGMNDILRAVNHILYSTLQTVKEMSKSRDTLSDFDSFHAYEDLMNYTTLQEFRTKLIAFYTHMISELSRSIDHRHFTIRKVLAHVQQHYRDPGISLESVAAHVHLNPGYLGKLFKDSEGVYFTDYVNQLRLAQAQRLLLDTSGQIAEIAHQVGFNSTSYFVTCFKKYTGTTPTKFRNTVP